MKKYLLILYAILFIGNEVFAQCPVSVTIVSVPDVSTIAVCKSTPVQLEANPSLGALTPQYIWVVDGDTLFGADSIITILANNQNVQVYLLTTTGCVPANEDTATTSIQILTVIIQSIVTPTPNCDPTKADILITSTGGTAPYNYNLVGIGTSATGVYNDVPAGTYTLYVTDDQGCNDTNQVTVTPIPKDLIPTVTPEPSCDLTKADILITTTGGTAPYSYNLVGIGTSATGVYNDVPAGTYTLYITDDQGCNDTNQVTVTPIPKDLVPTITPQITECNQTTADVFITTTGGTAPYTYDLQGIGQNSDGIFSAVPTGNYTLYISDSQGCVDTNVVSIEPFTCPPPTPTEVITPNGDDINDTWYIYNIQFYPDNEVFIFDRWGQRVYHKKGYENKDGWEVKYIGINLPVSTYYYILKVYQENSEGLVFNGPISIFR